MSYVVAFVAGACLSAVAASAQVQSGIPTRELPGITSTLTGTVVSSTTAALVLDDDRGVRRQFLVDGSSGLPAGLVAGMRVTVTFDIAEGGRAHLVHVGTSDTMDSDRLEGPPVSSNSAAEGATTSPTAEPPAVDSPMARDEPAAAGTDAEAWPPTLVTAALALGGSVALFCVRRIIV